MSHLKFKIVFVLVIVFLASSVAFSQAKIQLSANKVKLLDSIAIQDVPAQAPGIATAIIKNGQIIYEKLAGFADFKDSSLITRKTRFNIASNGKQFTALAVLQLIDLKKLKLSDDIRKFYPTLFAKVKEPITIQSLLNHTSGIRDCYDLWSLQGYTWWEKSFSNTDVLKLIEQQIDVNFTPNSTYLYSNTNYILLALIIEKVSGKSFVAVTNEMFKQLNMPNTSVENDYTTIRGSIARAYFNFGTWTTYNWIWNVCGDGNIFSTLEDQVQWEKIIQGYGVTSIKRALIAKSQQPIEGSKFKNYGYGVEFNKYKGVDYLFHEGATGAWKATVTRFTRAKTAIITLTNTGKSIPSMQTRQMADVLFDFKPDAAYLVTKPANIGPFINDEDIIGTYLTESDFVFQFEKKEGKMFLKRIGRNDVELEREADNIYHQKFDPAFKQEFTKNSRDVLQVTAYYINHAPYSLTKQSADFTNYAFKKVDGKFINPETGAILNIVYKGNQSYEIKFAQNDNASNGQLISPTKLLVDGYTLTFNDADKPLSTIYLSGDRIKMVKFSRVN